MQKPISTDDPENHLAASDLLLCNESPIYRDPSPLCVFSDSATTHQAPGNMPVDCVSRGPWLSSEPEIADNESTSTAELIIKRSKAFQSMVRPLHPVSLPNRPYMTSIKLCDAPPVILISEDHAEECRRKDEVVSNVGYIA